jgi:hypothetical protein
MTFMIGKREDRRTTMRMKNDHSTKLRNMNMKHETLCLQFAACFDDEKSATAVVLFELCFVILSSCHPVICVKNGKNLNKSQTK